MSAAQRNRARLVAVLAVVLVASSAQSAHAAAPPAPDTSFGERGIVAVDRATFETVATQPDGRVVVGGRRVAGGVTSPLLMRLLASGRRDPTFGVDGTASLTLPVEGDAVVRRIAMLGDGRIVALLFVGEGDLEYGDGRDALVRLRPDGTLDPTFSGDGILLRPPRDQWTEPELHVEPLTGRIALASSFVPFTSIHLYRADGRTDADIGDNGILRVNLLADELPPDNAGTRSVGLAGWALRADGSAVVAGSVQWSGLSCGGGRCTNPGPPRRDHLYGFDALGEPDVALGGGHRLAIAPRSEQGFYYNIGDGPIGQVHARADGRVVVVSAGVGGGVEIARFLRDGRRDRTFAGTGRMLVPPTDVTPGWESIEVGFASALDAEGRVLFSMADRVVRVLADGGVDVGFDPDSAWMPSGVTSISTGADGRIAWVSGRRVGILHGGSERSIAPRISWTAPTGCGLSRERACLMGGDMRVVRGRMTPVPAPADRTMLLELHDSSCAADEGSVRRVEVPVRADGSFVYSLASIANGRRRWSIVARSAPGGALTDGRSRAVHVRNLRARCVRIATPLAL